MAIMYPSPMPTYIEADPLRSSEVRIYNELNKQLSDDFIVYYSRPWLGQKPNGEEIDGEIDFTVAHKTYGILTIEVKGGRISRNGETDQWLSQDRFNILHKIKNPVEQARKGMYQLLDKLSSSPQWTSKFINKAYGVCFPSSSKPLENTPFGMDMPLDIFIFGEEIPKLGEWVKKRMAMPKGNSKIVPLGNDGIKVLTQLLARSFQLTTTMGTAFATEEEKIIQLTEEQYHVLDDLEHFNRLSIAGAAGTGKTLLALEKAQRLAKSGKKVLLTCYNTPLAHHLADIALPQENLTVVTFHELCGQFAYSSNISIDKSDDKKLYQEILPEALIDSIAESPQLKFDAIIVDEGQDFLSSWWDALQMALNNEKDGTFYVFYDDNQKLYGNIINIPSDIPQLPYRLTRNLRNTQEIFNTAIHWYKGGITRATGPHGRKVDWIQHNKDIETKNELAKYLDHLIKNENIKPENIGVAFRNKHQINSLINKNRFGSFQISQVDNPKKGRVTFDTIRRFKGLERNIIIIPVIDDLSEDELIYVAFTRAKLHLVIIGEYKYIKFLKKQPSGQLSDNNL